MKTRFRQSTIGLIAVFAAALLTQPVWAQANESAKASATQAQQGNTAAPAPTDEELNHFLDTMVQVRAIVGQMKQDMKSADSAKARTKIQNTTESKIESAIRKNDLTLVRYQQISHDMDKDPAVRKRLSDIAKKRQGKS